MKVNEEELELASSLPDVVNYSDKTSNKDFSSNSTLSYTENKLENVVDNENNLLEVKNKKKYKKNLIWDGPRWDLAHFDPTMSARERKKLIYYETLFNKLENNELTIKCSENTNINTKNTSQRGRKPRANSNINNVSEKESRTENTENNSNNKRVLEDELRDKDLNMSIGELNHEKMQNLLTPSRNNIIMSNNQTPSIVKSNEIIKSNSNSICSSIERYNNSVRRYNDWRIKLLNKTSSLQNTPSRVSTP